MSPGLRLSSPPRMGAPPGPGWLRQAAACLTSWAGNSPWRQSRQEKIIKELDRGGGAAVGLSSDQQPPPRVHRHITHTAALRHTSRTTWGYREAGAAPRELRYHSGQCARASPVQLPASGPGTGRAAPLQDPSESPSPLPLLLPSPHVFCLSLSLCPLSPHL